VFCFSEDEKELMELSGAVLVYSRERRGYFMIGNCPFLLGKMCSLHGLPAQPDCCRLTKCGGRTCKTVREHYLELQIGLTLGVAEEAVSE
jgi:hypothetical protein